MTSALESPFLQQINECEQPNHKILLRLGFSAGAKWFYLGSVLPCAMKLSFFFTGCVWNNCCT